MAVCDVSCVVWIPVVRSDYVDAVSCQSFANLLNVDDVVGSGWFHSCGDDASTIYTQL